MTKFQSKDSISNECFGNFRKVAFRWTLGVAIFAAFEVLASYFRHREVGFTISYVALSLFIVGCLVAMGFRGAFLMNTSIEWIELTDEKISFQTFPASVYLGLIRKTPMNLNAPRNLVELKPGPTIAGFKKKYTGDIYALSYAGKEYLIESNFFDNFSALKAALEKKE